MNLMAAISVVVFSVFADIGGPHRWRVVVPDEGQHHHQRLDGPHAEGVERRDGGMYPHAVRTHLHCALHAPAREKVPSPRPYWPYYSPTSILAYSHTHTLKLLELFVCSSYDGHDLRLTDLNVFLTKLI